MVPLGRGVTEHWAACLCDDVTTAASHHALSPQPRLGTPGLGSRQLQRGQRPRNRLGTGQTMLEKKINRALSSFFRGNDLKSPWKVTAHPFPRPSSAHSWEQWPGADLWGVVPSPSGPGVTAGVPPRGEAGAGGPGPHVCPASCPRVTPAVAR